MKQLKQLNQKKKQEEQIEIIGENGESILLEKAEFNVDYEPTEEEIIEYARYLGIDPNTEEYLMQIAYDGLKTPVEYPWQTCKSQNDDQFYYINMQTQEAMTDHPIDEVLKAQIHQMRQQNIQQNPQKNKKKHSKFLGERPQLKFESEPVQQKKQLANPLLQQQNQRGLQKNNSFLQDQKDDYQQQINSIDLDHSQKYLQIEKIVIT